MYKTTVLISVALLTVTAGFLQAQELPTLKTDTVTITVQPQHDAIVPSGQSSLAVRFNMEKGWHFYASVASAPGGMNLKVTATSDAQINFGAPIFPQAEPYFDKTLGIKLDVFGEDFVVYIPFTVSQTQTDGPVSAKVQIEGAVCSDIQCRVPEFSPLAAELKIDKSATVAKPNFIITQPQKSSTTSSGGILNETLSYPIWYALGLALLAGLSLNIMPCVWPILPIVVLRIVEQAKMRKGAKISMGLAFCLGILLFFACLAIANIVLHLAFGTILQWGDQFRNPTFVIVMAMVLITLALFMFDVFTIILPGSISGKGTSGSGYIGTIGMGFLAAVLSTPCSFGILAAAFAWAQGQPLLPATVAIMFIGIGMAVPYLVLTSIPGLVERLPKPGKWMDLFKKAAGFVLLGIAVWMITVVPQARRTGVLYYSVILAFCVWMWGGWVGFGSKTANKIIVRGLAVLLAVAAGYWLLSPPEKLIDWQKYDAQLIETSLAEDKPVLIKFTADWCLSCKAVEKIVYSRKDVAELIKQKNVVAIKADTTARDYPATKALKDIYNEPGVPVSILILPGRAEDKRWRDKSFAEELKDILEGL
ncbi:MAG: thioredoxin family protein [Sedimentisphaerales bacterium]|nr:thioredoxin family protein [Sedimentisphaerales bacterium]